MVALMLNGAWSRVCVSHTYFIPEMMSEEASIDSRGHGSPSYLCERAQTIAGLLYNRTPATGKSNDEALLRMAHSEQYGSLKSQLLDLEEKSHSAERDASSFSVPEDCHGDPGDNSAAFPITVKTLLGDRVMTSRRVKLTIYFKTDNGVLKWFANSEEPLS